ncbi:hypothetical protein GIB67_016494 [Kingdonia uniflora]|uniref:RNase H type-1 domain-containing protein n=1 Tax=Kingdonia uniflora TaxID=39325 RepID=A0A7J7M821_9MAGN|nr:hypothetical protein GIB67_016494 [Kingdonia uniflora]
MAVSNEANVYTTPEKTITDKTEVNNYYFSKLLQNMEDGGWRMEDAGGRTRRGQTPINMGELNDEESRMMFQIVKWHEAKVIRCSWRKPAQNNLMLNTDGSFTNMGGIGAILRDNEGISHGACAERVAPHTITVHELQAIDRGLGMAIRINKRRVEVGCDSTSVVGFINESYAPPWNARRLLEQSGRRLKS